MTLVLIDLRSVCVFALRNNMLNGKMCSLGSCKRTQAWHPHIIYNISIKAVLILSWRLTYMAFPFHLYPSLAFAAVRWPRFLSVTVAPVLWRPRKLDQVIERHKNVYELARIRTWNLLIRSQTRYPLRHKPLWTCRRTVSFNSTTTTATWTTTLHAKLTMCV